MSYSWVWLMKYCLDALLPVISWLLMFFFLKVLLMALASVIEWGSGDKVVLLPELLKTFVLFVLERSMVCVAIVFCFSNPGAIMRILWGCMVWGE